MDRLELLKALLAVAEEGSFTRAAHKLNSSNQLVSKYVSELESQLSVRLFNRTTRRVHLTEAGQQALLHARRILESYADMENHFSQYQGAVSGRLNISAPVSFSTLHLAPLLQSFKQHYPDVCVNLELSDRKVDVVEEGFDVVLRIGHLKDSSLVAKKIAPVRLVLCASPSYLRANGVPNQPEDLNAEHFLRYSYMEFEPANSRLIQVLKSYAHSKPSAMVANNGEVLKSAAVVGDGYVLQPTFIVGEALREGQLITILDDFEVEPLGLYAVYPHRKLVAPKLRVFIDFLSGYFGDPPYWDQFDQV